MPSAVRRLGAAPTKPAAKVAVEPMTERGRRTRETLVRSARRVFEDKGYLETRIEDIASAAGVAYGTFYSWFPSKEDVFREVVVRMREEDFGVTRRRPSEASLTPAQRIERATREYLGAYRRNAKMIAIFEQVATFNDEFRQLRRETRNAFTARTEHTLRAWQAEGILPTDIDAHYAASALGSMVDRSAYVWLVLGEPFDEEAVRTLNLLCVRALGFDRAGAGADDRAAPIRRRPRPASAAKAPRR